jgi:DNA-binding beta-propeller fold protein YncE
MLKRSLLSASSIVLTTFGFTLAAQAASFTTVASGLDNPRGFAFGPDNALYVTEAGTGGPPSDRCVSSPSQPGSNLCYGSTGAVTRVQNGVSERVVVGLPSIGLENGNGSYGPHDIAFNSVGQAYVLTGFATNPTSGDASVRDTILRDNDIGQILAIDKLSDKSPSWRGIADLAKYEILNDPDKTGLVSNPYSFILQDDSTAFVVESGANDVLKADLDTGEVDLETVFSERVVTDPISGDEAVMQSVPTAIVQGPDGAYYVSELTGVPYPEGEARIYRFNPGEKPEIFADGFTQLIDLAFDSTGNLYALEYATESLRSPYSGGILERSGSLIRMAPDGTRTTLLDEGLVSPNSLLVGPDDSIYVSNYGTFADKGEIIRIDSKTESGVSVPEYSSPIGFLVFGVCGAILLLKREENMKGIFMNK